MRWRRRRTDEDLAEEIQSHLNLETDRLVSEGVPADDARATALRRFGRVTPVQEWFYQSHRVVGMDHLTADLRGAARNLARYPIACLVAIVSLAGGIGATTATLTIRDVVFHRPPPLYAQPQQLSFVQLGSPDRPQLTSPVPGELYHIWRDAPAGLHAMAASAAPKVMDVRTADHSDTLPVRAVTVDFFAVLGVAPVLGRTFPESRATTSSTPVALSYRAWQTLLDSRPDAVGRVVWVGSQAHTVVGVMPERFWFSTMDSPLWVPLTDDAVAHDPGLEVVMRRPAGVTHGRLADTLQQGLVQYASQLPVGDRKIRLRVAGVEGTPVGHAVALALPFLLGTAVLLTLLIACANVAILVIAQWTAREHEIAIRASLGASRGRIVRALVTESILIAVGGGVLGIAVTVGLLRIIIHNAGARVTFFDLSIDLRTLLVSACITLLTGFVAGIGPALLETRRLHGNPMRTLSSSDRVRQRWRHALVILEIAVTVALLVVAATMLSGYRRSFSVDHGFRTGPLLTVRVENSGGVPSARVLAALEQVPGVASAAASTSVPYSAVGALQRVSTDAAGTRVVTAERAAITPALFSTLNVPMRAGRPFNSAESERSRTAIVNQPLADRLFAGRDPLGSMIWIGGTSFEIVGVVAKYLNNAFQPPERDPKVYLPLDLSQTGAKRVQFLVRAVGDPRPIVREVRTAVEQAAAGNAVTSAFTLDQTIDISGQEILVGTAPLAPLIATGLLLTAAGIYGVLAFAITRRSRELAVRAAVGATRGDLVRLVTAHSLRLVVVGATIGIGATFALGRLVRATGGAGSIYDPAWTSFVAPFALILGVGALATWIPSVRATRIDPAALLRAD